MSYQAPKRHGGTLDALSERSQLEKATHCIVSTIWHSWKGSTETIERSVVGRGRQR